MINYNKWALAYWPTDVDLWLIGKGFRARASCIPIFKIKFSFFKIFLIIWSFVNLFKFL